MKLESIIKCPRCSYEREEIMPTNSCMVLYKCCDCNAILRPKQGDCCVFCSYGSVKCPSRQKE